MQNRLRAYILEPTATDERPYASMRVKGRGWEWASWSLTSWSLKPQYVPPRSPGSFPDFPPSKKNLRIQSQGCSFMLGSILMLPLESPPPHPPRRHSLSQLRPGYGVLTTSCCSARDTLPPWTPLQSPMTRVRGLDNSQTILRYFVKDLTAVLQITGLLNTHTAPPWMGIAG